MHSLHLVYSQRAQIFCLLLFDKMASMLITHLKGIPHFHRREKMLIFARFICVFEVIHAD